MKRVYTDERFPDYEIVNDGSFTFQVIFRGKLDHTLDSWERAETGIKRPNTNGVSEAFAQRRAQDWFNRLEKMHAEKFDASEKEWLGKGEKAEEPHPVPVPQPGQITRNIDALMAKEKLEQDPERKVALRQQIMKLMSREESVATATVNHLIA